jgi:hypothetical protein
MNRPIFISSLLLLLAFGCHKETSVESTNDIPKWLQVKIDSMSANRDYFGSLIYRYKWSNEYYYHIEIPISSCAYCEVYNQNGTKIQFTSDTQFQDFLTNKTDQVLIWAWKK